MADLEPGLIANDTQLHITLFVMNTSKPEVFYADLIEFIENLTKGYIWNKEKFSLSKLAPLTDRDENVFVCKGSFDFGDNIEDEWFVVYVLFKLTNKFIGRVAAKATDVDGEFMLIHAANCLPEWASTADNEFMLNRVFIYSGDLYMIPPATTPAQVTYFPAHGPIREVENALKTLTNFSSLCKAPEAVQKSIKTRIANFEPDLIAKNLFHRATCLIPAKLAMLLKSSPGLIGEAINRFCDKDPKDLKLCRSLDIFKAVDIVNYRVLFTKHLYGKLKYCDFKPDLKSHKWPTMSELKVTLGENEMKNIDEKQMKERSILGFKLTCAFEMLSKWILSKENTDDQVSFESFIKKLTNLGYFKEYVEHSKNYNELYETAKLNYMNSVKTNPSAATTETSMSQSILDSFTKLDGGDYLEALRTEFCTSSDKDDSDDWLCVEAPQLDDYLDMYSRGDCSSAYDFRALTSAFRQFIKQKPAASMATAATLEPTTTTIGGAADFRSIDTHAEEKLIDIDTDVIQKNLKEILAEGVAIIKNEDSENDSFYEIDDDEAAASSDEDQNLNEKLKNYMGAMDEQLREEKNLSRDDTTASSSSNNNSNKEPPQELDIDLNLVSNAIESYSSQLGLTGPVSNILKSLGL